MLHLYQAIKCTLNALQAADQAANKVLLNSGQTMIMRRSTTLGVCIQDSSGLTTLQAKSQGTVLLLLRMVLQDNQGIKFILVQDTQVVIQVSQQALFQCLLCHLGVHHLPQVIQTFLLVGTYKVKVPCIHHHHHLQGSILRNLTPRGQDLDDHQIPITQKMIIHHRATVSMSQGQLQDQQGDQRQDQGQGLGQGREGRDPVHGGGDRIHQRNMRQMKSSPGSNTAGGNHLTDLLLQV
jgi:hypothetical protein